MDTTKHVDAIIDGHEMKVPAHLMPSEPVKEASTATQFKVRGNDVVSYDDIGTIGVIATCGHVGDAEFIVTACNAHDDLVKALKGLIRAGHLLNSASKEWNAVHAALAKAGAK